jgi:parallel beta-helix repeat protein
MGMSFQDNCQIISVGHNLIYHNLDGIGLVGCSYDWIWDNSIKNNDLHAVICIDCHDFAIQHNNISTSNYGIYIQECSITEISFGNIISENEYGVVIKLSDSNFIEDNKIINNNNYPLWLYHSNNNYILRNTITGNKGTVTLTDCEGNHFEDNVIFNQPELYLVITIVVLIGIASLTVIFIFRKRKKRKLE